MYSENLVFFTKILHLFLKIQYFLPFLYCLRNGREKTFFSQKMRNFRETDPAFEKGGGETPNKTMMGGRKILTSKRLYQTLSFRGLQVCEIFLKSFYRSKIAFYLEY